MVHDRLDFAIFLYDIFIQDPLYLVDNLEQPTIWRKKIFYIWYKIWNQIKFEKNDRKRNINGRKKKKDDGEKKNCMREREEKR